MNIYIYIAAVSLCDAPLGLTRVSPFVLVVYLCVACFSLTPPRLPPVVETTPCFACPGRDRGVRVRLFSQLLYSQPVSIQRAHEHRELI